MIIKLAIDAKDISNRHNKRVLDSIRNNVYENESKIPGKFLNHTHEGMLDRNRLSSPHNDGFVKTIKRFDRHKRHMITKNILNKVKKIGLPIAAGTGVFLAAKSILKKKDQE